MFRRSPSNKSNHNAVASDVAVIVPTSIQVSDGPEKVDNKDPIDPTVPRTSTSTLKRISRQLSKIPFQRKTLSKDGPADEKTKGDREEKEDLKKISSGKLKKSNDNLAVLEANGIQEKSTTIPTSGENALDDDVSEYVRKISAKQNSKIAELEEKLAEKERPLMASKNMYDGAMSQILSLKERLSKEDELKAKNDSLSAQISALDTAKAAMQYKLEELMVNLEKEKSEKETESTKLLQLEASITEMKESKALIESQVSEARRESVLIQNRRDENHQLLLQDQAIQKDDRLEESQNAYLQLRKEMDIFQQSAREVESKYDVLVVENSKCTKKIADLEASLQAQTQTIQKSIQERQLLEKENSDLKGQLTHADQAANEMKIARGVLSSENSKLKSENAAISSELSALKSEATSLTAENSKIKSENTQLLAIKKAFQEKEADQSKAQLDAELAEMKQKMSNADHAANEMKIARGVMSLELSNIKAELLQSKKAASLVENTNEKLLKDNASLGLQLASVSEENRKLLEKANGPKIAEQPQGDEFGSIGYYETLTKSLVREKSITEYALGTLKAQANLKEKEMDSTIKNLTVLLLKSERLLADSVSKTEHLLILNEELEAKVCHLEGYRKEPEEKLISLLAVVESRLNSAMIDIIICQENLENANADRDQKIQLLEESKKKVVALQDTNARHSADIQALREELFSVKLNYKDEIEKLTAQITGLGGTASVSDFGNNYGSLASMASKDCFNNEDSRNLLNVEEQNLKIPSDLVEGRAINLGSNFIEILKNLTTRANFEDVNQRISDFWTDLKNIQSVLQEHLDFMDRENSTQSSIFPGDAPPAVAPQNSEILSVAASNENSSAVSFIEGPRNSVLSESDHSNLVIDLKKKAQDVNYLEGEVAKLMNIMERRDELIKELQGKLEDFKTKQETSEEVTSLRTKLQETEGALQMIKSEKNNLADKNLILMSNSVSGIADSPEALDYAQKMGEMELRHALHMQKLKEQIKEQQNRIEDLVTQLGNKGGGADFEREKSGNDSKLQKLLMTSKIELFNLKNQSKLAADLSEIEIAKLTENLKGFQKQQGSNLKSVSIEERKVEEIVRDVPLLEASEFSWNPQSIYHDIRHVILNYPVDAVLRVEKRHLHYYHLCYTMTILAMLFIALPMTWSLLMEQELPKSAKQFTQLFACILAFLITKRPH